jgi:hypothetical protein
VTKRDLEKLVPENAGQCKPQLLAILERIDRSGWPVYLAVDQGWFPLIIEIDKTISADFPDYQICQIKEKFGGLRYYWEIPLDQREDLDYDKYQKIQDYVNQAEEKSLSICEKCGQPGQLDRSSGWLATRCEKHISV